MLSKKNLLKQLKNVLDPELGISLVDLGLIYDVKVDKRGKVSVIMTLTTMGCPLFNIIEESIKSELKKNSKVKKVEIELTFDPPWDPSRMSKEAKIKLGFF